MNNVLELKGKRFMQANKSVGGGGAAMNSRIIVKNEHLIKLKLKIEQIKNFWQHEKKPFSGVLISVHYNKIVAKSNRIAGLFKGKDSNFAIVGAKFNEDKSKHIITYYLDTQDLDNSMDLLSKVSSVLISRFKDGISKSVFENKSIIDNIPYEQFSLTKTDFKQVIADVSYIEDFDVDFSTPKIKESIITLYDTGLDTKILLNNIGIDIMSNRILDNQTVYLDKKEVEFLYEKAPYLVAMSTVNLSELSPDDFIQEYNQEIMSIPSPTIEPTIGVIDTLFDKSVYFSEWVDYHDMVDDSIPKSADDYRHGTAVSSIIVDGARLNPWLNDGCGRFKVRHFGVAVN